MVLRQSKRSLTFLPNPLGDMFCKSEGLIQSGTHILSYCADSFAMKLCPPIRTSRYRDVLYRFVLLIRTRPGHCFSIFGTPPTRQCRSSGEQGKHEAYSYGYCASSTI